MREIKYRVWNETKNIMDYNPYIWVSPFASITANSIFKRSNDTQTQDFIWMQFTWLLDKNGKEIYDGDICFKKWYWKKCVIRFNEEWLKFEAFYGIWENWWELTMWLWYWNKRHCNICNEKEQITEAIFWNTLEIIWNIYSDPELLTK